MNLMKTHTNNSDLLRPAVTRFATAFLTLQSIHKKKDALRKVFTCDEWNKSKWSRDVKGKKVMETVLSTTFWNNIVYAMKITAALVRVLRLVDGEKKPPMGYIYEAMDRAKETIKEAMGDQRYKRRDSIDPITLRDIDDCNEWLIGSMQELVHEDDDLTWDQVAEASGANEQRTRHTRFSSHLQRGGPSGSSRRMVEEEPPLVSDEIDDEELYIDVDNDDSDGGVPELQGEHEDISKEKARLATNQVDLGQLNAQSGLPWPTRRNRMNKNTAVLFKGMEEGEAAMRMMKLLVTLFTREDKAPVVGATELTASTSSSHSQSQSPFLQCSSAISASIQNMHHHRARDHCLCLYDESEVIVVQNRC
ncbi:hypothetical protein HHK36_004542 [Tetracentron sinense]|uniref:Uncharacterized protein n=1 Tax=Tetracentron sinense TaxID=13715 RepID=A0A834ZVF9_TETSI|nr:hypothetical protein HHK36_004542 [Tetracentron sinense]